MINNIDFTMIIFAFEIMVVITIISLLYLYFSIKKRKADIAAAKKLSKAIKNNESHQRLRYKNLIKKLFHPDSKTLESMTDNCIKIEYEFYLHLLETYIFRNSRNIAKFNQALEKLLDSLEESENDIEQKDGSELGINEIVVENNQDFNPIEKTRMLLNLILTAYAAELGFKIGPVNNMSLLEIEKLYKNWGFNLEYENEKSCSQSQFYEVVTEESNYKLSDDTDNDDELDINALNSAILEDDYELDVDMIDNSDQEEINFSDEVLDNSEATITSELEPEPVSEKEEIDVDHDPIADISIPDTDFDDDDHELISNKTALLAKAADISDIDAIELAAALDEVLGNAYLEDKIY